MQKSKMKHKAKKGRKKRDFEKKFVQKYQEYFPRGNNEAADDQIFNYAPVKKLTKKQQIINERRAKHRRKLGQKSKAIDLKESDSENETYLYTGEKKLKTEQILIKGTENQEDIKCESVQNFFKSNLVSLGSLTRMNNFVIPFPIYDQFSKTYSSGSFCLACVSDVAKNGEYLIASLSRNKKVYISCNDVVKDQKVNMHKYKQGEYIIAMIKPSQTKHIQATLRTEIINSHLVLVDIFKHQIVQGFIDSEEEHGYSIKLAGEELIAFLPKSGLKLSVGKTEIFRVSQINKQIRMINLTLASDGDKTSILKQKDFTDIEQASAKCFLHPGTLVEARVKKVLSNGVLVRFLSRFYGFIFVDHLAKPIEQYKKKDLLVTRCLASDFETKLFHLIENPRVVGFKRMIRLDVQVGKQFQTFKVKRKVFGGSLWVQVKNEIGEKVQGFLHKIHFCPELKDDELRVPCKINRPIMIKEYNFLEGYPIFTADLSKIQQKNLFWHDVKPGQLHKGRITKIMYFSNTTNDQQICKLSISLGKYIEGEVNHLNITDEGIKKLPRYIKQGAKIKTRVLFVDPKNKVLKLTLKPTLVSDDLNLITSFEGIDKSKEYYGTIVHKNEFGFAVNFINDIKGFLTFKDIEDSHNISRQTYVIGQTIKVHIGFVNASKKKIYLSLSQKAAEQMTSQYEPGNSVTKEENFPALNTKEPMAKIGQQFSYNVLKKVQIENESSFYLQLQCPEHSAFIHVNNLSDHIKLLPLLPQFLISGNTQIKCKIVKIIGKNVFVTRKYTTLKSPKIHQKLMKNSLVYATIENSISTGVFVRLPGNVLGFAPKKFLEKQEDFQSYYYKNRTVKAFIRKNDPATKKIYVSLLQYNTYDGKSGSRIEEKSFVQFVKDQQMVCSQNLTKFQEEFQRLKIGNYVQGQVKLVKDYGLILEISQGITGFLMLGLHLKEISSYKIDDTINCKILDINYDKLILDLAETGMKTEEFNRISKNVNFNLQSISKCGILEAKEETLDGTILLIKDQYLVVQFGKKRKIISIINANNYNSLDEIHDKYQVKQKITFEITNKKLLTKNFKNQNFKSLQKNDYLIFGRIIQRTENVKVSSKKSVSYKIGQIIKGTVNKISKTNIFLKIADQTTFARIHITQFDLFEGISPFTKIIVGQEVKGKVLQISRHKVTQLELTCLKDHLSLEEGVLCKNILVKGNNSPQGIKVNAVVKSIKSTSLSAIYYELGNNSVAFSNVFTDIFPAGQAEDLNNLQEHFKPGQVVSVYIKEVRQVKERANIQVSMFKPSLKKKKFTYGEKHICRIIKEHQSGFRVQLSQNKFAEVSLINCSDEFKPSPKKEFSLYSFYEGRIISQPEEKMQVSPRKSLLKDDIWELVQENTPTIDYKRFGAQLEKNGDVRHLVFKYQAQGLSINQLVMGYVLSCNQKGCFIQIGHKLCGRAALSELSHKPISHPEIQYYSGRLIIGRIVNIKQNGKIDISLKKLIVKYGIEYSLDQLSAGKTVKGIVISHGQACAYVYIKGTRFIGRLNFSNYTDDKKDFEDMKPEEFLPLQTEVIAKILHISKKKHVKITIGTLDNFFKDNDDREEIKDSGKEQEQHINGLLSSVELMNSEEMKERNQMEVEVTKKVEKKAVKAESEVEEETEEEQESSKEESEEIEEEVEEIPAKIEEEQDEILSSQDEEEENISVVKHPKKKAFSRFQKEQKIIQKEKKDLEEDINNVDSTSGYERLILRNPNSSYLWIRFAAFTMENSGMKKARIIMERALKVVNYQSESEKLNLWLAFINLEFSFGKEQQLILVFQRALSSNDPFEIYKRMIELYKTSKNWEMVKQLLKVMIKKFRLEKDAWKFFLSCQIERQKEEGVKEGSMKKYLEDGLKALPKSQHFELLSHYSILEYKNGNPEKGRNTFETILTTYPKRTDLWSIYLDMEIKHSSIQNVRNIFNRCLQVKLKPKKMKFFFKRYLLFETKVGDKKQIDFVKKSANEYVESILKISEEDIE